MKHQCKSITCGIDYLTCTQKWESELPEGNSLYHIAKRIEDIGTRHSVKFSKWYFYGYRGWSLYNLGHFAYGENSDSKMSIIQCSGDWSAKWWADIARTGDNVTRLDIAVDALLKEPYPLLCSDIYKYIKDNGFGERKFTLITNTLQGETLYVGSRHSDQFGRIYDKSIQQKQELSGSWYRYEVEFKSKRALAARDTLIRQYDLFGRNKFMSNLTSLVYDWFEARHCEPIFHRTDGDIQRIQVSIEKNNDKIRWLRQQVSPTIRRFILDGDHYSALDALGLYDFFEIHPRQK